MLRGEKDSVSFLLLYLDQAVGQAAGKCQYGLGNLRLALQENDQIKSN